VLAVGPARWEPSRHAWQPASGRERARDRHPVCPAASALQQTGLACSDGRSAGSQRSNRLLGRWFERKRGQEGRQDFPGRGAPGGGGDGDLCWRVAAGSAAQQQLIEHQGVRLAFELCPGLWGAWISCKAAAIDQSSRWRRAAAGIAQGPAAGMPLPAGVGSGGEARLSPLQQQDDRSGWSAGMGASRHLIKGI